MKKNVHVTPRKEGGWAVQPEKSERAYRITETQAEAIKVAKVMAKNQESELVIHGKDGKIRDKDSFGNDPNPPKDNKH